MRPQSTMIVLKANLSDTQSTISLGIHASEMVRGASGKTYLKIIVQMAKLMY